MIYGYGTYRPDTSIISSTERSTGLVLIDTFTIQPGASGSKSYPAIAANGLRWHTKVQGAHVFSTGTDGSGNPTLVWTAQAYNTFTDSTEVYVFGVKLLGYSNSYGLNVTDAAGNVIVSSDYPGPQCVGYLDFETTAQTNQVIDGQYTLYSHRTSGQVMQGNGSRRLLVLGLPDVGAEDTWYSTDLSALGPNENFTINLFVATKATSYKLPRLFIFALDTVYPSNNVEGIQVYSPAQKLLYDAGGENMALLDTMAVDYPPYGQTLVKTPNLRQAIYIGITSPGSFWEAKSGTFLISGITGAKRVGSQVSLKLLQTNSTQQGTSSFTAYGDATTGMMAMVVDLTYLGFVNGTGNGGGTTQSAPVITASPQSQNVPSGTTVVFSVTATGTAPLKYQWYRNGIAVGTNSATYSFTASTTQDGNAINCIVSNNFGGVQSATAILNVYVQSGDVPVSITSYTPANVTVVAGATASFSVTANGTPPFSYQWYRNGSLVPGEVSSSYGYVTTANDNGDGVWCVVTNGSGAYSATSRTATLTVTSGSQTVPVAISGSTPANVQVLSGDAAAFSVTVTGTAPFAYQWYRNGSQVGTDSPNYSYTTSMSNNNDTVWCVVTNNSGANSATSRTASVTVTPLPYPVITLHPEDVTANPGQVVYMRCEASPATRFAWYRNGTYVTDGQSIQLNTSSLGDYSYQCQVYNNTYMTPSNSATLHVVQPTATTFESYNDFSVDLDIVDSEYTFAIFTNGSTSNTGYPWANGTGDGSLYTVTTSADFTPVSGSLGSQGLSASWTFPRPASGAPAASVTRHLYATVKLNGTAVCSGTITVTLRNGGNIN